MLTKWKVRRILAEHLGQDHPKLTELTKGIMDGYNTPVAVEETAYGQKLATTAKGPDTFVPEPPASGS